MAEDIGRLPKWAQSRIQRLERDVRHYETILTQGPEDSKVFADPYSDTPRPLGNAQIKFATAAPSPAVGDDAYFKVGLGTDPRGEYLEVYGTHSIAVEPRSSNVVQIRLVR